MVLVKLHRPPPDMSIFLPSLLAFSNNSTRRPRRAAVAAHIKPAAPAPKIITSYFFEETRTDAFPTSRHLLT